MKRLCVFLFLLCLFCIVAEAKDMPLNDLKHKEDGKMADKKSLGANTLAYPAPVWVIGTYDEKGKPNAMTASWVGISCSRPPCVSISLRKATYTYGNIVSKRAYTVSIPSSEYVKQTDYFGMVSGRDTDKFSDTKLTPVKSDIVDAPYVKEFPLILECNLIHTMDIGSHTIFVGEIMDVKSDVSVLGEDGSPDMDKLRPILFAPGSRKYYKTGEFLADAFKVGKEYS